MRTKIVIDKNELSEMYKNGKSQKEIAEHFGCSKSTIQRKLAEIGLMKVRESKPTDCFLCSRHDCFGCANGYCVVLFTGYENDYKCKFYKKRKPAL